MVAESSLRASSSCAALIVIVCGEFHCAAPDGSPACGAPGVNTTDVGVNVTSAESPEALVSATVTLLDGAALSERTSRPPRP